jgi:DNA-binding MarR family transcriptional regulator
MGRGLSPQHLGILKRILAADDDYHPITMYSDNPAWLEDPTDLAVKEASAALNREAASTSRTLRRLRERGLVERGFYKGRRYGTGGVCTGVGWRLTAQGKELMVKLSD